MRHEAGEEGHHVVRLPAVIPLVQVLHRDVAVFLDEGGRFPAGAGDAFDGDGLQLGVVEGKVRGGGGGGGSGGGEVEEVEEGWEEVMECRRHGLGEDRGMDVMDPGLGYGWGGGGTAVLCMYRIEGVTSLAGTVPACALSTHLPDRRWHFGSPKPAR